MRCTRATSPPPARDHFNVGLPARADGQHGGPGGFRLPQDAARHAGRLLRRQRGLQRFNSIAGPIIPRCTAAQANDPTAQCSAGPINFWWPGAEASYKGLLVRADKRFSDRYQLSASYALQFSDSIRDVTQNLDDYFATYGPDLPRHNLTMSGLVDLPWRIQLSVLSTFLSRDPVAPTINGFNNTGTNVSSTGYTPLLGILGKGYLRLPEQEGSRIARQRLQQHGLPGR